MPRTITIEQFAVFAVTDDLVKYRVSDWTDWDLTITEWYRVDDPRHAGEDAYINGVRIRFYAARSENDAEWNDAPEAKIEQEAPKPPREAKIEQEAPKPPREPRKVTRTVDGIKWIKVGDKAWKTEDGRYEIHRDDDFETECDHEHPVRISAQMRKEFFALSDWDRAHKVPSHIRWAMESNAKGYLCPGDEIHFYGMWVGGTPDDLITRDDTLKDAMHFIAVHDSTGRIFV